MKFATKYSPIRIGALLALVSILIWWTSCAMLDMPGKSARAPLAPLTPEEQLLRNTLEAHVIVFASDIGPRNIYFYDNLELAASRIENELSRTAMRIRTINYKIEEKLFRNIEAQITGTEEPNKIIVIGAHYDSHEKSPGADDNASGIAALLAIANAASAKNFAKTLRLVAFTNEEAPFFMTDQMGSLVYARYCKEQNENIIAMFSLESIGYYSGEENSQKYPWPWGMFYPSKGDFIAFIGNYPSRDLVRQTVASFRANTSFPSEGAAVPASITGVSWSDHWSFWQAGCRALMITDTAPFRYPYYHTANDTPDKLDYDRLARATIGLEKVIDELAGAKPKPPPPNLANTIAKK